MATSVAVRLAVQRRARARLSRPWNAWQMPWSRLCQELDESRHSVPGVEQLDPLRAPGRRLPGVAEVDPLADHLLVAELHDPDGHHGSVVVVDRVLSDPEVVAAGDAVNLELLARRICRPERDDVGLAAHALTALRPLDDSVVGIDLRRAGDVISR